MIELPVGSPSPSAVGNRADPFSSLTSRGDLLVISFGAWFPLGGAYPPRGLPDGGLLLLGLVSPLVCRWGKPLRLPFSAFFVYLYLASPLSSVRRGARPWIAASFTSVSLASSLSAQWLAGPWLGGGRYTLPFLSRFDPCFGLLKPRYPPFPFRPPWSHGLSGVVSVDHRSIDVGFPAANLVHFWGTYL